jgi:ferric-dicitrate binding protein FerR (iron transport regulator)
VTSPRLARLAANVLARNMPPVSAAPPNAVARADAIDAIERTLARDARKRRILLTTAVTAAAAGVALAAFTWRHAGGAAVAAEDPGPPPRASPIVAYPLGEGASISSGGAMAALVEGGRLTAGSRVVTPANGRAALAFATGTSAMLGEKADLSVEGDDKTQVLRLEAGSVDLHVAKVSADRRFLVSTPDAVVEVRGTEFRVAIGPADPSCSDEAVTHLVVTEGAVVVRHGGMERRVSAGQQWPSGCIPTIEIAAPQLPSVGLAQGGQSVASSLAEQNDLFAEAIVAKHRSDAAGALAAFDRFLVTYPTSPLAQSAAVERMRLLRATASNRAVVAARQYLAHYPGGFARNEAEAIAAGAR